MTLNIFFMSVTFRKRSRSAEECNHDLAVFKQYEECKLKQQTFKML
ncbi:YrzI family small protein [Rossellomorea vietnamensis]